MDIQLNENNKEINNNYFCPYCYRPTTKPIINLSDTIYDQNFVMLINSLSTNIKKFCKSIKKSIDDIKNINSSLGNQTNNSKFLVKGIVIKNNNYIEKYRQLCDRIDMINESKKLLDDNFSLINKNMNNFIVEINQILKKMKIRRNKNINDAINNNNNYNILFILNAKSKF